MKDDSTTACLVTEAFTDNSHALQEPNEAITTELLGPIEPPPLPPPPPHRSVFHTTLGVASSAATFVLVPCVKAAVHATSVAVSAPLQLTNRVRVTIAQSWTPPSTEELDLVEELSRTSTTTLSSSSDSDLDMEEVQILSAEARGKDDQSSRLRKNSSRGGIAQLLFLPVRLIHSSVSTAVAIPTQVVTYSGRKLAGAVSASHALATSAVVASTGVATRTGMHMANGIKQGTVSTVSYTASTLAGAVGTSVRTVGYVIPPSVSNAVWQGMDVTGTASVNVLSYAIAMPSYRLLRAVVPEVDKLFSEEDAVNETRTAVKMMVKLLGPQNAFYLLKWVYETVNSEEAHDSLLLCRDVLNESLNGENYHHAATSVSVATGFTKVVNVVKEAFSVLPSFDELVDAVVLVADVSDEVVGGVAHVASRNSGLNVQSETDDETNTPRFEYVNDDDCEERRPAEFTDAVFESASSSDDELNPLVESGLSLLTRVCDSEEASSLFNTFGDFLDALVD
uniref:Uncharacterized protein n=2 Tax=Hyaloperonospora arabidopsidis (strain Emoy2) TaxID=559515 RepID=M4B4B8_HYAAE